MAVVGLSMKLLKNTAYVFGTGLLVLASVLVAQEQRLPRKLQQKVFAPAHLGGSYVLDFDHSPLNYYLPGERDAIVRLQRRMDAGEVKLVFEPKHGYLRSVLEQLGVPVSSQGLVFSKTSFQIHKIGPKTPRAIYFNDDAYVGYVQQGDVLELSAVDPERGAMFYTLDQLPVQKPKFQRHEECVSCHGSGNTLGIPGLLVRSVAVDFEGRPVIAGGGFITDENSPFAERWGGWYVTGTHGAQRHMGNLVVKDIREPDKLDVEAGANVKALSELGVDASPYLAPHSDMVALMVLQHQTRLHNIITRLAFETRLAMEWQQGLDSSFGADRAEKFSESNQRRMFGPAETLLRYMLFVDEPKLRAAVRGTSNFTQEFSKRGPHDRHNRSLRELDLNQRLFRYPLSFLIYSEAFDAIPAPSKEYILRRLADVLSGADRRPEFAVLSKEDRQAILEILTETKPEFAALLKK